MKADAATRKKLAEIGRILRAARLDAGVSQAALAERIGMARENYVRLDAGRVNATVETLLRVASGIGVDLRVVLVKAVRKSAKREVRRDDSA